MFCVNCGRDLRRAQLQRPPMPQQPGQPANQATSHRPNQPVQSPRPVSTPAQAAPAGSRRRPTSAPVAAPLVTPLPTSEPEPPEPPAPFPPRTMAHFEALLTTGGQAYVVIESHIENGQKKVLTIAYQRCANWQQAATLLKALRENLEDRYPTTVVRGLLPQQQNSYDFTNGQLQFDRNVRLGSQIGKRYMLETGNGYAADALRFVLNV